MPRAPRAPRDPPPSSSLARSALDKLPIAPSPYPRHRARNNYDLSTNSAALDDLGLPAVTAAAVAVATWADDHSSLPRGFFRDATIRMSTAGALHVKLVLQWDDDYCSAWRLERAAFVAVKEVKHFAEHFAF